MKNKIKIISAFILLSGFLALFPSNMVKAQNLTPECQKLIEQFNQAKVGNEKVGANIIQTLPKYCTESSVYKKISTFAFYIIGIIGVISYIYGGYLYMLAGASENNKKKGKEILIYTTLGIAVVLSAAGIVNMAVKFITGG